MKSIATITYATVDRSTRQEIKTTAHFYTEDDYQAAMSALTRNKARLVTHTRHAQ